MIRIQEALKIGASKLSNLDINAQKEARILLSFVLNVDQNYLFLHENEIIDAKEYLLLIQRRCNLEPIEYITKSAQFYSREFFVDQKALIPRPETEILVEKCLEVIEKNNISRIVEVGVGSGVISILLALHYPHIKITATDISKDAIELARINAKKYNVINQIQFVHTSLLDGLDGDFEFLISNPPYIQNGFELEKNLSFEPQNALFGGDGGHEILFEIIELAHAKKIVHIACEMGYDQKKILQDKLFSNGFKASFYQDLAGFDRGFVASSKATKQD